MYVKQLMACFHRRCMWLDRPYSIDVELISSIIGLQNQGDNPVPYLAQKDTTHIK